MKKTQAFFLSCATLLALIGTEAHAQDKAWTLSRTYISADATGKLYRRVTKDQTYQMMRVDKLSGRDTWVYETKQSLQVAPECSEANRFFLTTGGKAVALDAKSGKPAWTFDSSKPKGSFTIVCPSKSNALLFFDSRASGSLSSLDKATGRRLWTYNPKASFNFIGQKGQNVYISTFKDNHATIISLKATSGRVQWERKLNENQAINSMPSGEPFVSNDYYSFSRLDPKTGKDLWTLGQQGDEAFLIWNPKSLLYVSSNGEFRRLDPATGEAVWTNPIADNSQYQVLSSGQVLIRSENARGRTDFELWGTNGEKLWETAFPGEGYVREDSSANLFYVAKSKLTSIQKETGDAKWTFVRANPVPRESLRRVETYGKDVIVNYASDGSEDPATGLLSLDAESGSLNWDVWENATVDLVGAGRTLIFATRSDGSASYAYER